MSDVSYNVKKGELIIGQDFLGRLTDALGKADTDSCWAVFHEIGDEVMRQKVAADPTYSDRLPASVKERIGGH